MPKNIINEFDRTGTMVEVEISNTVFIPIHTSVAIPPELCETVTELKDKFEASLTDSNSLEYSANLGYNLCEHLIKSGLKVLVQGVTSTGSEQLVAPTVSITDNTMTITQDPVDPETYPDTYYVTFSGWDAEDHIPYGPETFTLRSDVCNLNEYINKKGSYYVSVVAAKNGFANSTASVAVASTLLADVSAENIALAIQANAEETKLPVESTTAAVDWTALEDRNLYDIRFLTCGALKVDISQDMIDCAKNRGDCTALVNFNEAAFTDVDYVVADFKALVATIVNGEYAAAFTPAFYTKHVDFTDDEKVLIPASFAHLFAYARSIKSNPEWFATAGFDRGIIPELFELKHTFSTAEVNALQCRTDSDETDNVGIAINATAYVRPAGNILYGNRTLKNADAIKKLTATSFLNVRNMLSLVKKVAYEAANKFAFEQNSEVLWVNYKSYIEPTLEKIVHGNGALGYSMSRIKTDVKAKLQAEILIQPIEAVEDIEVAVIMTETGTTVNE